MKISGDEPINPCIMQQVGENTIRLRKEGDPKEWQIPMSGITILQQFAKDADVSEYYELTVGQLCELTGIPNPDSKSASVKNFYRIECLAKLKVMKAKALIKALNEYGND